MEETKKMEMKGMTGKGSMAEDEPRARLASLCDPEEHDELESQTGDLIRQAFAKYCELVEKTYDYGMDHDAMVKGFTKECKERLRQPEVSSTDEHYFGHCPHMEHDNHYLNIGRDHWMVCDECRLKWHIGENLFSSWRTQTEAEWQANAEQIKDYTEARIVQQDRGTQHEQPND
jgi:hypothetical protein